MTWYYNTLGLSVAFALYSTLEIFLLLQPLNENLIRQLYFYECQVQQVKILEKCMKRMLILIIPTQIEDVGFRKQLLWNGNDSPACNRAVHVKFCYCSILSIFTFLIKLCCTLIYFQLFYLVANCVYASRLYWTSSIHVICRFTTRLFILEICIFFINFYRLLLYIFHTNFI